MAALYSSLYRARGAQNRVAGPGVARAVDRIAVTAPSHDKREAFCDTCSLLSASESGPSTPLLSPLNFIRALGIDRRHSTSVDSVAFPGRRNQTHLEARRRSPSDETA